MGPYIFLIATILAVLPISFLFKVLVEKIKENPEQKDNIQTKLFIGVALIEVIPIILVIFGFINMEPVQSMEELYIPGLLILLLLGFAIFFIFLQKMFDVNDELKTYINSFAMIGVSLVSAIPIISLVSLGMMMPN